MKKLIEIPSRLFDSEEFAAPHPSSDNQRNGDDELEDSNTEKNAPVEPAEVISWRRKPEDDTEESRRQSDDSSRKRYSPDRRRRSNGRFDAHTHTMAHVFIPNSMQFHTESAIFSSCSQMIDATIGIETTGVIIIATSGTTIVIIGKFQTIPSYNGVCYLAKSS